MLAMIKEQQAAKNMKKKSAPKRSLSEKIKVKLIYYPKLLPVIDNYIHGFSVTRSASAQRCWGSNGFDYRLKPHHSQRRFDLY